METTTTTKDTTVTIGEALKVLQAQYRQGITTRDSDDLSDPEIFKAHWSILGRCAHACLAPQFRKFELDDCNKKILEFLLYYFNGCEKALEVFPEKNYKLSNNIMLCGEVGVGKTLIMQIFAKYLEVTRNPRAFKNLSVTQMMNYYKQHNHLDKYTFNEDGSDRFEGNPYNVCLNDVGLQTHMFFGTDTKVTICEFFYARNDIWQQMGKFAHVTTNLTPKELKEYFDDGYGRLVDRFKSYNVIYLQGNSRR